jgi:hypothetical protein
MSKQCRFFLLPSDIERLLDELRSRVGFRLISSKSLTLSPTELESPISESKYVSEATKTKFLRVYCYLMPLAEAEIKFHYLSKQGQWAVLESSEVIQFSGCDYDGSNLSIGRFYFQNDQLIGDTIWPKRDEFLQWADRIFRTTKKLLDHSKSLQAYLGKDAAEWELKGGRFKYL